MLLVNKGEISCTSSSTVHGSVMAMSARNAEMVGNNNDFATTHVNGQLPATDDDGFSFQRQHRKHRKEKPVITSPA